MFRVALKMGLDKGWGGRLMTAKFHPKYVQPIAILVFATLLGLKVISLFDGYTHKQQIDYLRYQTQMVSSSIYQQIQLYSKEILSVSNLAGASSPVLCDAVLAFKFNAAGQLVFSWRTLQHNNNLVKLNPGQFLQAFADYKPNSGHVGTWNLGSFRDSDGKSLVALWTITESPQKEMLVLGGIISSSLFQLMLDAQSRYQAPTMIVNEVGIALAHSDENLIGTNVSAEPVVQEILKNKKTSKAGNYVFEKLGSLNAWMVISGDPQPLNSPPVALHLVFLFSGFAFIGLAYKKTIQKTPASETSAPQPAQTPEAKEALIKEIVKQVEVIREIPVLDSKAVLEAVAYEKNTMQNVFSVWFAKEFKTPLTAIMGLAQQTKTITKDTEVKTQAQQIEEQALKLRRSLDWAIGGEIAENSTHQYFSDILNSVVKETSPMAKNLGVQITLNLDPTLTVHCEKSFLVSCFKVALLAATEKVADGDYKLLEVSTYSIANNCECRIQMASSHFTEIDKNKILGLGFDWQFIGLIGCRRRLLEIGGDIGILPEGKGISVRFSKEIKQFVPPQKVREEIREDIREEIKEEIEEEIGEVIREEIPAELPIAAIPSDETLATVDESLGLTTKEPVSIVLMDQEIVAEGPTNIVTDELVDWSWLPPKLSKPSSPQSQSLQIQPPTADPVRKTSRLDQHPVPIRRPRTKEIT